MRACIMLVLTTALGFSCGTPCSRIAAGESAANDKGAPCGTMANTDWDSARIARCEANLTKCSAEDQKWADTYADCLQKLPTCAEGQSFSWGLQRLGCAESLFKISGACLNATK